MTEDEMVGWHHLLNGHEFEQILVDSEGQGTQPKTAAWIGPLIGPAPAMEEKW